MRLPTEDQIKKLLPMEVYQKVLKAKAKSVKTSKDLQHLDHFYRSDLPKTIERDSQMSKEDLVKLMSWKLARGKYRATLPSLIASNPEDQVEIITRNAFSFNSISKPSSDEKVPKEESRFESFMKEATKLKGVGPATASALLAMLNPEEEPFFSDELAEWMWNLDLKSEKNKGKGKASSQKIKIDYTMKFYREFRDKVKDFRKGLSERGLELNAQEVERVAWTLWNAERFGVDLEEFGIQLDEEEEEKEEEKPKGKQNSKRKAIVEDEKTTKDPNHQESTKTSSSSIRSSKRTKSSKS